MGEQRPDRDAVARVARWVRETSERSGHPLTHTQATERVARAIENGDRKRENKNR